MALRILIAEDDDLQGAILEGALKSRGYDTEIAVNGLEAVRRLRTGRFDLALMDFNMPEINGLAAARLTHDLLPNNQRPQMIAVTSSAEKLHAEHELGLSGCFDAIVSKRASLPALLSVIETNLSHREERRAMAELLPRVSPPFLPSQKRRVLEWLYAWPALAMAAAFTVAVALATTSLQSVDAARGAMQTAEVLTANTATLIDKVHDTELSQRSFLASGSATDRAQFEADAQHVDQLLVSRLSLSADNAPGFDSANVPQAIIEPRLKSLAEEAQRRPEIETGPRPSITAESSHMTTEQLRGWASSLLNGTLGAADSGMALIRQNTRFALVVLIFGIGYSLWNARQIIRRRAILGGVPMPVHPVLGPVIPLPRTHPILLLEG